MSTLAASPAITDAGRRRIVGALFVARGGIGVGYLAGFIVITIAAKEISGHAELAGLPAAISMVGRAIGPPPIARAMDVFGRRPAIAGSYALGAVGALTCALAIAAGWFWLLLVGSLLMGVARAATGWIHPRTSWRRRALTVSRTLVRRGGTAGVCRAGDLDVRAPRSARRCRPDAGGRTSGRQAPGPARRVARPPGAVGSLRDGDRPGGR